MDSKQLGGAPKQVEKSEDIKILSFQVLILPTPMGGVAQVIWGLGDDQRMYLWDSKLRAWMI